MMNTESKILDFINEQAECVLATVNEHGSPQAATVGFSATPDLVLTIGTSNTSRKYQNILRNPHVAVVIGFEGNVTVQIEGVAHQLIGEELKNRLKVHFQKLPDVERFNEEPDQVYIAIEPRWARYTNYAQPGDQIEEVKEFV